MIEARTMGEGKLKHINRRLTDEERARHAKIRAAAMQDIPPKPDAGVKPSPSGIPARIRQAREAQGLTWYALAKVAGIPNQATIRDIEQGKDVKFSNLQAVARVLGLELALVEQTPRPLSSAKR
jgi:DNA-binding XRE family transcriptional regulator